MKIRLNQDLPVEPKHGMGEGKELETLREAFMVKKGTASCKGRSRGYYVTGDAGEDVLILHGEYEVVEE